MNRKKDILEAKITDAQYSRFIIYITLLLEDKTLPPELQDHMFKGELQEYSYEK